MSCAYSSLRKFILLYEVYTEARTRGSPALQRHSAVIKEMLKILQQLRARRARNGAKQVQRLIYVHWLIEILATLAHEEAAAILLPYSQPAPRVFSTSSSGLFFFFFFCSFVFLKGRSLGILTISSSARAREPSFIMYHLWLGASFPARFIMREVRSGARTNVLPRAARCGLKGLLFARRLSFVARPALDNFTAAEIFFFYE